VDAFGQISDRWRKPLYDGFEAKGFSASGGLYFKRSPEQEAGIVEFQSQVTYRGNGALKLSLRAGREETPQISQRAEILERPDLWVPYNEGIWYGFAVKFAEPIPQDDHRYVIAQWKREIAGTQGDFSPFLALRLNRGKLFATVETNLVKTTRAASQGQATRCEAGETAVWLRPETNQTRALVATDALWTSDDGKRFSACTRDIVAIKRGNSLPTPASGWIDFVIYSKPGPDGTGLIEIFANDKWVVTVKGRIGHGDKGLGQFQYFKFGPYRATHHDSWTLYYDEFRRSVNRADVFKNAP
jgi:hypothetical protein